VPPFLSPSTASPEASNLLSVPNAHASRVHLEGKGGGGNTFLQLPSSYDPSSFRARDDTAFIENPSTTSATTDGLVNLDHPVVHRFFSERLVGPPENYHHVAQRVSSSSDGTGQSLDTVTQKYSSIIFAMLDVDLPSS